MDDLNFREQLLNKTSTPFPTDYCSERKKTQAECIEVEMRTYDRTECGCKAQCKETVLKTQTSSSMWPSHIGWFYKALEHNLT